MINSQITIEQLKQLNDMARIALYSDNIGDLYLNNQLSFEQLNQLNFNARLTLEIDNIRYLFEQGMITFAELFLCTDITIDALNQDFIRNLFINNHFTFEQLQQLLEYNDNNHNQLINNEMTWDDFLRNLLLVRLLYDRNRIIRRLINILRDDVIYNLFINNEITFDDIIRNLFQARLQVQNLNDNSQSTHTTSVHESVSDSAQALSDRYGQDVINDDVTNHISELKSNIEDFSPNETITSHIHQAAKRGIDRLENLDTDFIDHKSQLSIKELITLTLLAGEDENYRLYSFNDYLENMILALYEIQRGYNIENGIDDMRDYDDIICLGGTFNKIIEKMVGILPDCHIVYITSDTIFYAATNFIFKSIDKTFEHLVCLSVPKDLTLSEDNDLEFWLENIEYTNWQTNQSMTLKSHLIETISNDLECTFGDKMSLIIKDDFTINDFIDLFFDKAEIATKLDENIKRMTHTVKYRMLHNPSIFFQPHRRINGSLPCCPSLPR